MYLSKLYPKPTAFEETGGGGFKFGAKVSAAVTGGLSEAAACGMKRLWRGFTFTAGELEVVHSPGSGFTIRFGKIAADSGLSEDGYYAITSDARGALLTAVSEKALLDGFATLVQLIEPLCLDLGREEFALAPAKVSDRPSMAFRSIHLCVFPESELSTIEKAIHLAGFLKFTHVILEFWGMLEYAAMPELSWRGKAFTKTQILPIIALAHSYGMEVIPMSNQLGHAAQSRVAIGRHTVLNRNPRRQLLFEPDGWTWCASNPDTYKLLGEMRAELMDLCGAGSYFHLGFDEAYSFGSCPKCRERVPHELLAEYINRLTEDLAKDGRRPIIWHDELINREDFKGKTADSVVANGQTHNTAPAIDLLDRRIIIADWQYDYKSAVNPTTPYFIEKGFDTVVCPWDVSANVRGLAESARASGAMGIMLTTWHHLPAFLPRMFEFAGYVWGEGSYGAAPRTEAAAILRRIYENDGDYLSSGWKKDEVDE